ncbi:glycosyltransferase [Arcicella rosea]|uniref:Glycosyltransferase involved in cell wall biosynthesis n=1 Tax=Arcicella rosea TaxID=502909 RepID=A0A841EJY9_9BACT|nr:glycosyltransferase [Arcicella rosea]MBB6004497.1 glycosyltransferase involved in cell wall biosynthesis [Arcicella rosea]
MKVLIVHNQLWAHYKAIIFNELQLISNQEKDFKLLVLQLARIEKSRLKFDDTSLFKHQYNYQLLHDGLLEDLSLKQRVVGILKTIQSYRPDVVNLTGYYDLASLIVLWYCKLKGIKTVLSNESTSGDHTRDFSKELFKSLFIINFFDGFFNFGQLSKEYMLTLGAKASQMLVNRNCVDNQLLEEIYKENYQQRVNKQNLLNLPKHNFIFVGRLIEFKNLFKLIDAFKIAQKNEDWGLIMLGDGDLKTTLKQYAQDLGIQNIFFFEGVNWQQVPQYLSLSDVLVLPSFSEPWGLVVNEAMACGLPVAVSNKCGCAAELVKESENGFTFNPENVNEIAETLVKFMDKKLDLMKMGEVSKQIIQEYSPINVAKEMFQGYQKLCHPKK